MRRVFVFVVLASRWIAWAQAQAPAPSPAAAFSQAANILQGAPQPAAAKSVARKRAKAPAPDIVGDVEAVSVSRMPPIPGSAALGLSMAQNWLTSGPPPTMGKQGQVVYVYGSGVPTVVCAILTVCEIDLEPGETLEKDAVNWGDNRWEVAPRKAGSGADEFNYIVVKPQQPGLDTTMTLGTNKRPYYIRLVSTSGQHMARVAFSYPDEERKKKELADAAAAAEKQRQAEEAAKLAALNQERPLKNWDYEVSVHGKDAAYLRPAWIGDDGRKTYLQLGEEARHHGLPAIEILGETTPANVTWRGDELVVDAIFQQACLVEGVGKKQQRVCVRKGTTTSGAGQKHGG